jgi:hypothetical protein
VRGPIHGRVWVRGDQAAVRAVEHIQEAILVRLDDHLPRPAANLEVDEHVFVGGVDVVDIIRRVLVVADELAGLRADRNDT